MKKLLISVVALVVLALLLPHVPTNTPPPVPQSTGAAR